MIYAQRIWRGLQLGLDFFFLRMLFLAVLNDNTRWYGAIFYWLLIGAFVALGMDDFMQLRVLFKKPGKQRGAAAD